MKNGYGEGGNWENENQSSMSSWKPPIRIQGLDQDTGNKDIFKMRHGHMTQPSHSWVYTPRKLDLKETRVPQCSSQNCL